MIGTLDGFETTGLIVGCLEVGFEVGLVGAKLGVSEGDSDGLPVGSVGTCDEGLAEGAIEGEIVGRNDGVEVGWIQQKSTMEVAEQPREGAAVEMGDFVGGRDISAGGVAT